MRVFAKRVGLLAAAGAALAVVGASPAAAATAEPSKRATSDRASSCAGPCPTLIFFTGNGHGRVYNRSPDPATPAGSVVDCPSAWGMCDAYIPDVWPTIHLRADPNDGSVLQQWKGCSRITEANDCELWLSTTGGSFVICPVFAVSGMPAGDSPCPPITPPSPPPPPPAGPPPLGSRCTIRGTAGPDRISGTSARDVICARGGSDVVNGRGNHDLILGGGGNDRVTGGAGRDHLRGQTGRDTLYSRDSTRDTVNGGSGRDRARVDRADRRLSIEWRF